MFQGTSELSTCCLGFRETQPLKISLQSLERQLDLNIRAEPGVGNVMVKCELGCGYN